MGNIKLIGKFLRKIVFLISFAFSLRTFINLLFVFLSVSVYVSYLCLEKNLLEMLVSTRGVFCNFYNVEKQNMCSDSIHVGKIYIVSDIPCVCVFGSYRDQRKQNV